MNVRITFANADTIDSMFGIYGSQKLTIRQPLQRYNTSYFQRSFHKKIQLKSIYSVYWDLFCISTFQSLLTRALTFLYLPSFNLGLLLAPTQLSFDWSMGAIPLLEALSDTRLWVALASYSVLLLIFVKGCLKNVIEKGSYSLARGK